MKSIRFAAVLAVTTLVAASGANAASLKITVTNLSGSDGLYLTPFFSAFHDGTFDSFDAGSAASPAVEDLAEEGIVGPLIADVTAAGGVAGVVTGPAGFSPPPVLDPGESNSIILAVDPTIHRFFSFLSMIIPSNDFFLGNDNPMAYEVFDALGAFTGIGPINVLASGAWDAGTEEDDGKGAAFSGIMDMATDTIGGVVGSADLSLLLGRPTAPGPIVGSVTGLDGVLARIEISAVPLPAGVPLLLGGLGCFAFLRRRIAG